MVAETFEPQARFRLAERLPSEETDVYLRRLVAQLEDVLGDIAGPRTGVSFYDTSNRPILTPAGIYGYNAGGLAVLAPDIVQIDTADLVDAAVETAKLGPGAVTDVKILDATIGKGKFAELTALDALVGDLQVVSAEADTLRANHAQFANLNADRIIAGTAFSSLLYVGTDSNPGAIRLDGPNSRIEVTDDTASPNTNVMVRLGKLATGEYGMEVFNESGTTVMKSSYNGSTFVGSLNASLITVSNINASNINTGTLDASVATVTNLDAANITTGFLAAARIQTGSLDGGVLTANTVDADKMNVTTLSAISANLGTITAGTINGGTINGVTFNADQATINGLNANQVTAGTFAAARIGVNTVDATKINVANLAAISANLGTITAGTINGGTINGATLNADQATINNLNFTDISQGDLNVGTQLATDALTETSITTATNTADLPVGEGSCLYTTIAATLGDEFLIEIMGTWDLDGTAYASGGRASIAIGQSVSPHSSVGALFTSFNALRWESGEDGEKSFAMGYVWAPTATNTYRIHILGDAPGATAVDSVFAVVKVTRLTPQG